jgi:hypothetical protein
MPVMCIVEMVSGLIFKKRLVDLIDEAKWFIIRFFFKATVGSSPALKKNKYTNIYKVWRGIK